MIFDVHRHDVVEPLEVVDRELPRAAVQRHTPGARRFPRPPVRHFTDVVGAEAGAVYLDLVVQLSPVHERTHDPLGRGRATDVAEADEADAHHDATEYNRTGAAVG